MTNEKPKIYEAYNPKIERKNLIDKISPQSEYSFKGGQNSPLVVAQALSKIKGKSGNLYERNAKVTIDGKPQEHIKKLRDLGANFNNTLKGKNVKMSIDDKGKISIIITNPAIKNKRINTEELKGFSQSAPVGGFKIKNPFEIQNPASPFIGLRTFQNAKSNQSNILNDLSFSSNRMVRKTDEIDLDMSISNEKPIEVQNKLNTYSDLDDFHTGDKWENTASKKTLSGYVENLEKEGAVKMHSISQNGKILSIEVGNKIVHLFAEHKNGTNIGAYFDENGTEQMITTDTLKALLENATTIDMTGRRGLGDIKTALISNTVEEEQRKLGGAMLKSKPHKPLQQLYYSPKTKKTNIYSGVSLSATGTGTSAGIINIQ